MPLRDHDTHLIRTWLIGVVALILVGMVLRTATVILVPVVFSVFVTLLILPVVRQIEGWTGGRFRWVGIMGAMVVLLLAFALFLGGLWIGARRVANELTRLPERLNELLPAEIPVPGTGTGGDGETGGRQAAGTGGAGGGEQAAGGEISQLWAMLGERAAEYASSLASTILGSLSSMLGGLVLAFFFVLLMLVTAPSWRGKAETLWGAGEGRSGWNNAFEVTAYKLRLYLLARAALGVVTAVAYVTWLWIFGVDLLFVWALITFLLNFIPNIGSVVSGVLPVLYAALTKDFGSVVIIGLGILAIEQFIGNFLDPKIAGQQVALSPLVVLLAILFWGWIWGVAGALLGVPIVIAVMIVSAHMEASRPFALLLSDKTDFAELDRVTKQKRRATKV